MSLERKIYQSILKVLPKRNYFPLSEPEITKIDKKFVMECMNTGWVSSNGLYLNQIYLMFLQRMQ